MIKISLSYMDDSELKQIMALLEPVLPKFRIKTGSEKDRYKHVYLTEKKPRKTA